MNGSWRHVLVSGMRALAVGVLLAAPGCSRVTHSPVSLAEPAQSEQVAERRRAFVSIEVRSDAVCAFTDEQLVLCRRHPVSSPVDPGPEETCFPTDPGQCLCPTSSARACARLERGRFGERLRKLDARAQVHRAGRRSCGLVRPGDVYCDGPVDDEPQFVDFGGRVVDLDGRMDGTMCALRSDGVVACVSDKGKRWLLHGLWRELEVGAAGHVCVLDDQQAVFCSGSAPQSPLLAEAVLDVRAHGWTVGHGELCVAGPRGDVLCRALAPEGAIGPTGRVPGLTGVVDLAAGSEMLCAATASEVYCWSSTEQAGLGEPPDARRRVLKVEDAGRQEARPAEGVGPQAR